MLEALGPDYLLQHVADAWCTTCRDRAYRAYLAENLRIIGENTSKFAGGSYIEAPWQEPDEDGWKDETRTPEEIIADITAKFRGSGIGLGPSPGVSAPGFAEAVFPSESSGENSCVKRSL